MEFTAKLGSTLLSLLLGLGLAGPVSANQELGVSARKADLRLGCLYPMTGPGNQNGRDAAIAIGMALEKIHRRDDGSPKLNVVVEDTRNKQFRASEIARQLIDQQQVQILCGVLNSGIALEISNLARATRTLFIGGGHASSQLTNGALHPWYFRVSNDSKQSMRAGARYLRELQQKHGWKTLAYIGPDYDYGHQIMRDMLAALDALQVEYSIVAEYYPKLLETDFSEYITALAEKQPDILISGHWGDDFVFFVRQANAEGLLEQTRIYGFEQVGGYYNLSRLGDDLPPGMVLAARHHINWPETAANKEFVETFHSRAGHYPSHTAQDAYSVIIAVAEAWKAASQKNVEGVRKALPGLSIPLPEDPPGYVSWIDPQTQQIMQAVAIGESMADDRYPPATRMLGNWQVFYPESRPPQSAPAAD
ncbi:ABC transporter substrate-binding protein [Neptuniibacter halophilus]|uniref:ABC transporter substrate-binding protein n=1 Tax=Neptuniibacter halophilus TaxID=651666 RepID=UPI0025723B10|nr:ABC transporter substrate-binding protein [Neptuniibacter halophilus]